MPDNLQRNHLGGGMSFAGFDRADCPDLALMARLRAETNLTWCGYYLRAPSQPASTWLGKREALVAQGWGLAPIYVGQETTGPGSHNVTAAQGRADGTEACARMHDEGFPLGSWVYLDLENGPPFLEFQREYVTEWVAEVDAGGFRAGVYASFLFAAEVKTLCPDARLWVYHVPTTTPHEIVGSTLPAPEPADSGYPQADIWQRDDTAVLTDFDDLVVDLDSAVMRDPGAPSDGVLIAQAAVSGPVVPGDPTALAAWIQGFLNARGARLYVDGNIGPMTQRAIADFLVKHSGATS